jgi:hypothetical protein
VEQASEHQAGRTGTYDDNIPRDIPHGNDNVFRSAVFPRSPSAGGRFRHDRRMPPQLHLHPDRLHGHARSASGLADELHAALRGAPAGLDIERLRRAAGELVELSDALRGAAAAGSAADAELSTTLTRLRDALDRR